MTNLAWGGYKNGQIPLSALALIPSTNKQYIKKSLLPGLQALRVAFKKHFGTQLDIVEAYRDLRRQENLRYAYVHHYPGYNLAAIPGTSLHGWALSVDFGSRVNLYGSAQKTWMDAHAPAYGFLPTGNSFDPREAWHFDGIGTVTASLGGTTIQKEIIDMATGLCYKQSGKDDVYWQEKPNTPLVLLNAGTWTALKLNGMQLRTLAAVDFKPILDEGVIERPQGNSAPGVAYLDSQTGAVYWQAKPGAVLVHLTPVEWAAYKQNGLALSTHTTAELAPLLAIK